jgi:putative transcriptional regulator
MQTLQGQLLIASPHLGDSNFNRTVVLMVQHTSDGALGLVLNRPSGKRICDIWQSLTGRASENEAPIYVGGPLEGPLMAVHTSRKLAENEIVPGLWFATHKEHLHALVEKSTGENSKQPFRLFSGYSGWGSGQLEGEMKAGGWLLLPATAEHVFADDDDEVWQLATRTVGHNILKADRSIKDLPEDPSLN